MALGLGAGAVTYYTAARALERGGGDDAGPALALGAFLDGIPEQMVLGLGLATGGDVGVGLLAAIFVSNLPEAIGSASSMRATGKRPAAIRRLWTLIAVGCTLATVGGYALADVTGGDLQAAIDGFAAGALLVMLVDSMIPEALSKAGRAGAVWSPCSGSRSPPRSRAWGEHERGVRATPTPDAGCPWAIEGVAPWSRGPPKRESAGMSLPPNTSQRDLVRLAVLLCGERLTRGEPEYCARRSRPPARHRVIIRAVRDHLDVVALAGSVPTRRRDRRAPSRPARPRFDACGHAPHLAP